MMQRIWTLNGKVINVGDWDYALANELDRDGKPTGRTVATNPPPAGAVEAEADIAWTAKGRIVLAADYEARRQAEYPPTGDQLDALWKGGADAAAMKAEIDAVKAKYPKP